MMSFNETLNLLLPSVTGKDWSGLSREVVEEERIDRRGLLADDAGEGCALGPVAEPRRTQAAVQVHLHARGLRQLIGGQFRAPLVEVVRDAHGTDRVGTRRPGPTL